MKNTALITGASSGIGLELAKIHASKGGDLVLIARSEKKLKELKIYIENAYSTEVVIITKDLSENNAARAIYNFTQEQNINIEYLINNAGFGDFGDFANTDWNKEAKMIDLNIKALTQFTKLYLQLMIAKGQGRIMNVASAAAFQPGPGMAVYYATKAYVLHFTEAVNEEVKKSGVKLTALCPGATESGFKDAASLEDSKLFKNKKIPSSKKVAEYGYKAMLKGKPVAIHGFMNSIMVTSIRFTPRKLVVKIVAAIQKKA